MSKQGEYTLTISRLTVDKLGVKLYDKASAVVSELIANAYDADAKNVTVSIPLATLLDDGTEGGGAYQILVVDDGHGMSPSEAQAQFLRVGKDRRFDANDFKWVDSLKTVGHTNIREMIGEAVPPRFTKLHGTVLADILRGSLKVGAMSALDPASMRGKNALKRCSLAKMID